MRQLGRLLQDGHRMDEAVVYYTSYLNARPRAKQVWLDLAASFASDKKWIEAEESIGEMLQVYPGDESGRYNLGAIAANAGDLLKARQIWSEISENGAESAVKAMAKLSLARLN
jgi:tetratricopeptide (TPR) repeat protein